MLVSDGLLQSESTFDVLTQTRPSEEAVALIERSFGRPLTLVDGTTGDLLSQASGEPVRDWGRYAEQCRQVARLGKVEFLDDEAPLFTMAIPLPETESGSIVAVGTFVARQTRINEDLGPQAAALSLDPQSAALWASQQRPLPPDIAERLAGMLVDDLTARVRVKELEQETDSLSSHLAGTYEEISLLYRLTQNLKISESDEDLGQVALEWMHEVLPVEAMAIQLVPLADEEDEATRHGSRTEHVMLSYGDCPLDSEQFSHIIEHLGPSARNRPVVLNPPATLDVDWPAPDVKQLIVVSLAEGDNLFGWLAAINHPDGREFGTVEASLLSSVAAILGIHSGNIELYRQQAELLVGVVRALTSAIDAKDPYTCGHSDRVARVAACLAEELGITGEQLNTIYLSGLLHDIGKIGVEDEVLRKPGKLSEEEYEHIKRHVEIGHKILRDLGKLDEVLPVVLYHHESWDGSGYPHKLGVDHIPLPARIVAVADAFDAMGSDRPYRKGMPDEKIDAIFRAGSGQQWDPDVVDAFFRVRKRIGEIVTAEQDGLIVDLPQQA